MGLWRCRAARRRTWFGRPVESNPGTGGPLGVGSCPARQKLPRPFAFAPGRAAFGRPGVFLSRPRGTLAAVGLLRVEIAMSLDGYVAGPDQSAADPLGKGGEALHEWAFALDAWRQA